jgi:phosphoglycolate phosphatase
MTRCVAFDFDGTLVQSNAIKRDAFFAAVAHIPGAHKAVHDLFASGFDGDRYQLFAELSGRLVPEHGAGQRLDAGQLADAYSRICHEQIRDCDEVPGASQALASLKAHGISCFVVSATPERDLKPILADRQLGGYFKAVYGRPGDKPHYLRHILVQEGIAPAELTMVGDGSDDKAAAASVGCTFIAIANSGNANPPTAENMIEDLHPLPRLLLDLGDG